MKIKQAIKYIGKIILLLGLPIFGVLLIGLISNILIVIIGWFILFTIVFPERSIQALKNLI